MLLGWWRKFVKRNVVLVRPRCRAPHRIRARLLALEALETRELLAVFLPSHTFLPALSPGPEGFTPPQIRHAYGFDQIQYLFTLAETVKKYRHRSDVQRVRAQPDQV